MAVKTFGSDGHDHEYRNGRLFTGLFIAQHDQFFGFTANSGKFHRLWADKRPLPSMTPTQLPDMQSALGAWLVEFKVIGLHYWDSLYFVGCTDRHSSK